MKHAAYVFAALLFSAATAAAQSPRIASDFEIAKVEAQLQRERDPLATVAGRLNLGDLYASRAAIERSDDEYARALEVAEDERADARRDGDMARYANATAYAGLANAKLRRTSVAWDRFAEATRYAGGSATLWNLAASGMLVAGEPRKAAGAARNALRIAERAGDDSVASTLDRSIYRYSLAAALAAAGDSASRAEATRQLETVVRELESDRFADVRARIRETESFEVLSSTRSDAESYISLLQRSRIRLAALYEADGRVADARKELEAALRSRRDDATALAAMSRLATTAAERERYFDEAFDANPFSWPLFVEYSAALETSTLARATGEGTGDLVRAVAFDLVRGASPATRAAVDRLAKSAPSNDLVAYLDARLRLAQGEREAARRSAEAIRSSAMRRDLERRIETRAVLPEWLSSAATEIVDPAEGDLRALANAYASLDPSLRARLDALTFESAALFDAAEPRDGNTLFARGRIGTLPFRFAQPTAFRGAFEASTPLRLRYRILAFEFEEGPVMVAEPLGVTR